MGFYLIWGQVAEDLEGVTSQVTDFPIVVELAHYKTKVPEDDFSNKGSINIELSVITTQKHHGQGWNLHLNSLSVYNLVVSVLLSSFFF